MSTVYQGNNTAMQNLTNRDERLAGQTVSKNGYNVTYNDRGYVTSAAKIGTTAAGAVRAPSADAVLNTAGRNTAGASTYDRQYLSNADLQNIADVRALAQNGAISWDQANSYANNIRSQYGYTGGADGSAYIPAGGGNYHAGGVSTRSVGASTAQSYPTAQNSYYNDLTSQLLDLYSSQNSAYQQQLAAQKAAQEAAVQKAVNSLETQKASTDQQYSDLFRQLYVDRMKSQKNLNQQLAAGGITGGAAESTRLGYDTAYEDALRQGEQSRIGAINGLDQAIADARLTGDIESANAAADAAKEQTSAYADTLRYLINRQDSLDAKQTAYDREDAQRAEAYAREDAQRAAAVAQQLAKEQREAEEKAEAEAKKAAAPTLTVAQVNAAIKAGVLTDAVLAAYEYYYGEAYRQ